MSRRRPSDSGGGGGSWMDTYGDMVTLLLTFFVLLFSFSTVDAKKWQELVASFSGNRVVGIGSVPQAEVNGIIDDINIIDQQPSSKDIKPILFEGGSFNDLYETMSEYVKEQGLDDKVMVELVSENQILFRFGEQALFDSGRADIKEDSIEFLNMLCDILTEFEGQIQQIAVEGHTDTDPVRGGDFKTNRRLSNERALQVVEYIEKHTQLPEGKLFSTGRGENMPIAPNDTPENKAKNRRVDIIIYSSIDKTE